MPPKKATTGLSDDGLKLLEASKRWRAEFRKAETNEDLVVQLSAAVSGAFDELTAATVKNMDKIKGAVATATSANNGANIANGLANKAVNMAQENLATLTAQEAATSKRLAELELRTKAAMNQLQKYELAKSETTVMAKGISPTTNSRESQDDLKRAIGSAIRGLNVQGVTIEFARRLQRVRGDRLTGPPALKVTLGSVADKLKIYEAIRAATQQGKHIPFEIQNEIPQYTLGTHKQLNKIALEMRKQDRNLKTRVSMLKGDQWPQIRIKRRGEKHYHTASKDLVEMARQGIIRANKARAAERRITNDDLLLEEDTLMETEQQQPTASTSTAGGPASVVGTPDNGGIHN